jgi:Ca2+/Na+ antiporter
MFETLQPPPPEPAKGWFAPSKVYGFWCVLGASGVFISFWKHGASARVGFVSYATVFALALYFLLAARTRPSMRKDVSTRSFILFLLGMVPTFMSMFQM